MAANNLTAILYKINDLRMENRPIPEPKDDEVLLKMGCVGICGSDVHYLVNGRIADFVVNAPMIMGHEAAGTVTKLGKNVKSLQVGDRVAIEPGVPCRCCNHCKEGRYNLCEDVIFCATPPVHGNLSQYYCHAADFCFKLPANVSLEEGAILEPLSVGVHACRRGEVGLGDFVLIMGAGPIGLVSTLSAKAMGASKVITVDLLEDRLALAKNCGADETLKIKKEDTVNDVVKKIVATLGRKPDKTVDCSGNNSSVNIGLAATKNGGCFVLVGMGANEVTVPLVSCAIREIDIRGSFRYNNDYQRALDMVASGKVNVKQLITHRYELEQTLEAFETAKNGTGNPVKIMIRCNK